MILEGKRILVTGAGRGIGLAIACACLEQGARLLVTDSDESALDEAEIKLNAIGGQFRLASLDVTNSGSIAATMSSIGDWPALDGLVNNAAILDISHASNIAEERWNRVLDVNLTGALRVTKASLPKLKSSSAGSIVNTVSTQAFWGVQDSVAYATSKGGLMMLTRSMAVDFGGLGIRVNAVAPGFIDTRMAITADGSHEHKDPAFHDHYIKAGRIPLRRPGKPEDCTGSFVFLLSGLSKYITGQAICVDGGLSATY